jgi:heat shock protein HslJ
MNLRILQKIAIITLSSTLLLACSSQSDTEETEIPATSTPATVEVESSDWGEETAGEEKAVLGGTSWQLVQIMSMDDSTYVPEDPSLYTLNFTTDGAINVVADCNRGKGSWTSEAHGNLQFGPIAATMAMCQPGSLHDIYMAQFQWVRSYVMQDGRLFLATMADGAIIEFKPVAGE